MKLWKEFYCVYVERVSGGGFMWGGTPLSSIVQVLTLGAQMYQEKRNSPFTEFRKQVRTSFFSIIVLQSCVLRDYIKVLKGSALKQTISNLKGTIFLKMVVSSNIKVKLIIHYSMPGKIFCGNVKSPSVKVWKKFLLSLPVLWSGWFAMGAAEKKTLEFWIHYHKYTFYFLSVITVVLGCILNLSRRVSIHPILFYPILSYLYTFYLHRLSFIQFFFCII